MTKSRTSSFIATFVPCYLFWMLLTMSLQPVELISGLVVCLLTAWFASGFYVQNAESYRLLSLPRVAMLIYFIFFVLMWEILKANWEMAKIILTRKKLRQAIVKIPVHGITNYYGLGMLADCITLTPGTITYDITQDDDGVYYLHVQWIIMETADPEEAAKIIAGRMEGWIRRIWE